MDTAAHDYEAALSAFATAVAASHLAAEHERLNGAARFAAEAHAQAWQLEKYTGRAYAYHFVAVALLLLEHSRPLLEVLAALLHDVLEDTKRTSDELAERFGWDVATVVAQVSNISRHDDGNRAVRKAIDLEHLRDAGEAGNNVKLADVTITTVDLVSRDRKFARVYLPEKAAALKVLVKGDAVLTALARSTVSRSMVELGLTPEL